MDDWGPWVSARTTLPPEGAAIRVRLHQSATHTFVRVAYGRRIGNAFCEWCEGSGASVDYSWYVGDFSIRSPRAIAELRALIADQPLVTA